MTPAPATPLLWVAGSDRSGAQVVRARLEHGDDPVRLLSRLGFAAVSPLGVAAQADPHELVLRYSVRREPRRPGTAVPGDVARDADLLVSPDEQAVVVQRVAVYALVRSARGILLAQNSARTNAAGTWGLPGGGLEPGELPEAALHREVWEETGQRVEVDGFVGVTTRHWVGRAPHGRLEDFHAVRLVYRATCAEPVEPVVHDLDGTTSAAAWVPVEDVPALDIPPGWRDVVLALLDEARPD